MKRATISALAFVGAALTVPSAGLAQSSVMSMGGPDAGWLVGGSFGQSKIDCDTSGIPGASCDDSDTAWRIFGGYQFNRHVAVELGYSTLGEASISLAGARATVEAKAWDVMAVGILPVADRFSVYGKLGWFKADTDLSTNIPGTANGSDSSSGLTYAIGVGYDFSKNFGLRAEWQQYKDVGGDNSGGESDVDVMSIGVVYRFR
jgi:OmpA-OmpF porin, OOP family